LLLFSGLVIKASIEIGYPAAYLDSNSLSFLISSACSFNKASFGSSLTLG